MITQASVSEPERSGDDATGARRVSEANQLPGAGNLHAGSCGPSRSGNRPCYADCAMRFGFTF